jgi:hypothetical protein
MKSGDYCKMNQGYSCLPIANVTGRVLRTGRRYNGSLLRILTCMRWRGMGDFPEVTVIQSRDLFCSSHLVQVPSSSHMWMLLVLHSMCVPRVVSRVIEVAGLPLLLGMDEVFPFSLPPAAWWPYLFHAHFILQFLHLEPLQRPHLSITLVIPASPIACLVARQPRYLSCAFKM